MIFPQLPKRYSWIQHSPELVTEHSVDVKTPLHSIVEPTGSSRITVEEWWIKHGLATDPAALSKHSGGEPIDWWARDAWEFYTLCAGIVCWIVYWYGVHHGAW